MRMHAYQATIIAGMLAALKRQLEDKDIPGLVVYIGDDTATAAVTEHVIRCRDYPVEARIPKETDLYNEPWRRNGKRKGRKK